MRDVRPPVILALAEKCYGWSSSEANDIEINDARGSKAIVMAESLVLTASPLTSAFYYLLEKWAELLVVAEKSRK